MKAALILYPVLICFMMLAVIVAMVQAAVTEVRHWSLEFRTLWMFITH